MSRDDIKTPFGEIGYITYKRTYARRINEADVNSRTEEFPETVERVIKACKSQLKVGFSEEEEEELESILLNLKGMVAGRFLWQLGTTTVKKLGLPSLQNCAFVVVDDPIRPFTWCMDMLMLGSGVGYNIQKENVYQLPKVKSKIKISRIDSSGADFIVPDSREGWVKLLGKVLKAHFYSGEGFTFSTQVIRSKDAPIKGFGGTASGPEELCWGISEIHKILNGRSGKKLRPIDCLDIMNIIGQIVVAGNVRRSAQIAIGDCDDFDFLKAKRWDLGNIPNWRSMSNNSVVCDDISRLPEEFWETYNQGEPYGLINLKLSRSIGRLGETQYPDLDVMGYNPCQPDFALLLTPEGVKTMSEVNIGDKIWSKQGWTSILNKWSTGIKPVYNHRTTTGVFVGTDNHRVDTRIGKVEVKDADEILTISGPETKEVELDSNLIMDGLFLSDGYHKKMIDSTYTSPLLCIEENDSDYFESEIKHLIGNLMQQDGKKSEYRVDTSITSEEKLKNFDTVVPERLYLRDDITTMSLLRGMYSADGSVIEQNGNSVRITYKTASKTLSQQVQIMLSSVGIRSYITTNKSRVTPFKNGTYTCKESYDVNITKDFPLFYKNIGFIQTFEMHKISKVIDHYKLNDSETYGSKVETEYLGDFEVFDITVNNDSHTYWTGGLSVSNCAEQSLANFETCCLAELYISAMDSKEELIKVAKYLYRICKHSLSLPCHNKETEEIVHKNMRMGIGITGVWQATEEQRSWLDDCYKALREYDVEYSAANGFPISIKLTTSKPSGTLGLLRGVTPGSNVSPAGPFFIRRIRISSTSSLVDICKKNGYYVEFQRKFDGSTDKTTVVVEFPCKIPITTPIAANVTAIDQLEMIKKIQTIWSDNAVSVTVTYKMEELPLIKNWLKDNYTNGLKTVSFLLYHGHGFDQAPYETITEEKYNEMILNTKPIRSIEIKEDSFELEECASGACPIK